MISDLHTALLELLHELRESGIKLIIGGGYGLYLRTEHIRRSGVRTLLDEWPEARSTNDLDLFLRPELLIDSNILKPLADALAVLGYRAIPGAENYQFVRTAPDGTRGNIKIDILTGPEHRFYGTRTKVDDRRVHPQPSVGIHAHPTNEALTLEEGLLRVSLGGTIHSGEFYEDDIFLPHPYTFLMMKLFAFRDRYGDEDKEYGRYHALDTYTILATVKEEEWREALGYRDTYKEQPYVREAGQLVMEFFSDMNLMGIIRLRESRYYRPDLQLDEFMSALREMFPQF